MLRSFVRWTRGAVAAEMHGLLPKCARAGFYLCRVLITSWHAWLGRCGCASEQRTDGRDARARARQPMAQQMRRPKRERESVCVCVCECSAQTRAAQHALSGAIFSRSGRAGRSRSHDRGRPGRRICGRSGRASRTGDHGRGCGCGYGSVEVHGRGYGCGCDRHHRGRRTWCSLGVVPGLEVQS